MGRLQIAMFALLCASSGSAQSTWHVDAAAVAPFDGTQAHPFVSIAQALVDTDTLSGDTVLVASGIYGALSTSKSVTIRSSHGPLETAISPEGATNAVQFVGPSFQSLLEGFKVYASPNETAVRGNATRVRRAP